MKFRLMVCCPGPGTSLFFFGGIAVALQVVIVYKPKSRCVGVSNYIIIKIN